MAEPLLDQFRLPCVFECRTILGDRGSKFARVFVLKVWDVDKLLFRVIGHEKGSPLVKRRERATVSQLQRRPDLGVINIRKLSGRNPTALQICKVASRARNSAIAGDDRLHALLTNITAYISVRIVRGALTIRDNDELATSPVILICS